MNRILSAIVVSAMFVFAPLASGAAGTPDATLDISGSRGAVGVGYVKGSGTMHFQGQDYPVLRLPAAAPLNTGRVRPLPEDRVMNKPITFDAAYASVPPLNFTGSPVAGLTWLDDGQHFLQVKD